MFSTALNILQMFKNLVNQLKPWVKGQPDTNIQTEDPVPPGQMRIDLDLESSSGKNLA